MGSGHLTPTVITAFSLLIAIVLGGLMYIFRSNKLLFRCLIAAFAIHVGIVGIIWLGGYTAKAKADNIMISNVQIQDKQEEKKEEPKELKKIERTEEVLGTKDGDKTVEKTKLGDTTNPNADNKPVQEQYHGTFIHTGGDTPDGVPAGPGGPGLNLDGKSGPSRNDIPGPGGTGTYGLPGGSTDGTGIKEGVESGKINGKLYFMRIKHSSGSWNSYSNGISRLLSFMNTNNVSSANNDIPMTLKEVNEQYISKSITPTFLYFYCDDNFSLSEAEVNILKNYMQNGGFLFLDSRRSDSIESRVKREMRKVLPAASLTAISNGHSINNFQYTFDSPGVGMNFTGNKRYNLGIQQGGRYVVFYTMGNFAQFYAEINYSNASDYEKAQYQMGANVVLYAINKGDGSGIRKIKGASTEITPGDIDRLSGMLGGGGSIGTTKHTGEDDSIKVKPPDPAKAPAELSPEEDPDIEINLF